MPDTPKKTLLTAKLGQFAAQGHEVLDEGVPTKKFKKDLIRVGKYIHPAQEWTLDVTAERMDEWIEAWKKMKANGVRVPLPAGHSYDPRDGQGFLVELTREGDTLWGVLEFVGEDAISLAYRTQQVSISINPHFVDGKGIDYGEVIEHVALTGYPVVPDQEDFKAIAASLYVLATEEGEQKMTPEQLKKLQEMLGLEELTAENAAEKIGAKIEEMQKAATELQAKLDELQKAAEEAKAAADEATPEVDPEVIDDRAESAEEAIDGLAEAGKILPSVAASLKAAFVGPKGKRFSLALSRRLTKTDESLVKKLVAALRQNDPVKLGEQTRSQSRALSQEPSSTDGNKLIADAERRANEAKGK